MDVLSQILEDIHLKQTEYVYLQTHGEWICHSPTQSAMITHIVLFGEMHVVLEDQQKIHLKTGDMLIIPSGMSHHAANQLPLPFSEIFNIEPHFKGLREEALHLGNHNKKSKALIFTIRAQFDSVMASPLIQALPAFIHLKNALNAQEPEWLRIGLYFVADENKRTLPGRHKIMDHVVSIMLIESIRDYMAHLDDPHNWLNALTHPELCHALQAIHQQPAVAWSVESLAECCFMSRSKFAELFHKVVGQTPLAYLQQHRLRLASQHLRFGQLSVQQIAHRVGYNSETAFSQTFKKHFAVSPSQYRQQHLNS